MRLEKNLDPNPIQEKLKTAVTTFKEAMPIVKALRNEYLGETHWAQIKGLIKKDFDINQPDFTLDSLIALDVNQF
jgi:dynein heavy chain